MEDNTDKSFTSSEKKNNNMWASFVTIKVTNILHELEEERWWQKQFYGVEFTETEWNEYCNKRIKEELGSK